MSELDEVQTLEMVLLLTTGGSIDSYRFRDRDTPYASSQIPGLLTAVGLDDSFVHHPVCMKSSGDITSYDRRQMRDDIFKFPYGRVIITHGLDTIDKTAQYLATCLSNKIDETGGRLARTILLTGSSQACSVNSNEIIGLLGQCFGLVQLLDTGVYVFTGHDITPVEPRD